jgi:hypothetical protein
MTTTTSGPASKGPSMTDTDDDPEAATARADVSRVVQALARILEHAATGLAEGHSPHVAMLAALAKHRPSLALARVARAAWALVVRADDASTTRPAGAEE